MFFGDHNPYAGMFNEDLRRLMAIDSLNSGSAERPSMADDSEIPFARPSAGVNPFYQALLAKPSMNLPKLAPFPPPAPGHAFGERLSQEQGSVTPIGAHSPLAMDGDMRPQGQRFAFNDLPVYQGESGPSIFSDRYAHQQMAQPMQASPNYFENGRTLTLRELQDQQIAQRRIMPDLLMEREKNAFAQAMSDKHNAFVASQSDLDRKNRLDIANLGIVKPLDAAAFNPGASPVARGVAIDDLQSRGAITPEKAQQMKLEPILAQVATSEGSRDANLNEIMDRLAGHPEFDKLPFQDIRQALLRKGMTEGKFQEALSNYATQQGIRSLDLPGGVYKPIPSLWEKNALNWREFTGGKPSAESGRRMNAMLKLLGYR